MQAQAAAVSYDASPLLPATNLSPFTSSDMLANIAVFFFGFVFVLIAFTAAKRLKIFGGDELSKTDRLILEQAKRALGMRSNQNDDRSEI